MDLMPSVPREYNAAEDLIGRNLQAGRADKVAYIDDEGAYTFGELARRVERFASALVRMGVAPESRVFIAMLDTIDWPVAFLGAIKAGAVPVAANTLLKRADYRYMIDDSRARLLFVSDALLAQFAGVPNVIAGKAAFERFMQSGEDRFEAARTTCDDACFWLYSSGSTGAPKGTVHVHSSPILTAELYAKPVLGLREDDVVFSAAKLFFAYGLGNALSFPLAVGATTVLMRERPTPAAVFRTLTKHKPTVFYGVPTLYAAMLAAEDFPGELSLRICTSAGEALPKELGERWKARTGVDILDGIGSTELLHIFISNRPGEVRYGTTGRPVPGYQVRITNEQGGEAAPGEVGDLWINGPTAAAGYWNQREKSRATFCGEWTRSGDKYSRSPDGLYTYAGRSDDMLKVSGIYVSPFEVEAALASHEAVLEAAVVGAEDAEKLVKPKAYVVLKPQRVGSDSLRVSLQNHVKERLAPYKYPRWIEFVPELPKTATGKIQRFKLRRAVI
jgi:benzoate-CoA ligase